MARRQAVPPRHGPGEIGGDPGHGRDQRGREDQSDGAEERPACDRHDQHRKRVDAERGAHRERLHQLLKDAVGQQLDDDHPHGGVGARSAEGEQDRKAPAAHAPR